jgi:hypothetical protein
LQANGSSAGNSATVEIAATVAGSTVRSPGAPDWVLQCAWTVWSTPEVVAHFAGIEGMTASVAIDESDDTQWSVVFCDSSVDTGGALLTGWINAWPVGEPPPQAVLDWLVAYAYALVDVPVQVGWAAPFGDDQAPLITQLPTWLWVEPEAWGPRSATTPPVFGVTATVTVTPVNVTFEGADGEVVDCGPNLAPVYDFDLADHEQHSDCTLTYHHSSAVGEWSLTSIVTWEVTYVCSAFCGPGTLAPLTVVNTRPVRVAELQAVLVPGRT